MGIQPPHGSLQAPAHHRGLTARCPRTVCQSVGGVSPSLLRQPVQRLRGPEYPVSLRGLYAASLSGRFRRRTGRNCPVSEKAGDPFRHTSSRRQPHELAEIKEYLFTGESTATASPVQPEIHFREGSAGLNGVGGTTVATRCRGSPSSIENRSRIDGARDHEISR